MSRRHPLSSTRAFRLKPASRRADRPEGSCDVAGIKLPAIFSKRDYFFFLATLRVFFAVFFTALFAFFAFFAFLAMLPSNVRWLIRCVHSGIEMHYIPNKPP